MIGNLTEGIIRARYRESQEKPAFMNPGQTYKFTPRLVVNQQPLSQRAQATA